VTSRREVLPTVSSARGTGKPVLIDFRVVKEEAVYPMVPSGANLDAMIRRPVAEGVTSEVA
jgi:acetolactate synthase-1/2/3 large subunit